MLSLFAVNDGRSRVLAERQFALCSHFGVAKKGKCHVLVVVAGFGVGKYLCYLFVVFASQKEVNIAESGVGEHRQRFGRHFQYLVSFKFANRYAVLGK